MTILKRYKCIKSNDKKRFTVGEIYPLYTGEINYVVANNDTKWYAEEFPLIENQYGVLLKLIDEEPQSSDLIDNQAHYKNQGIEPIDLMRKNFSKEEFTGFLQGNVLKYMLRYKDKNGLEDLKKAKTYLTWLIEEEQNAEI